MELIVILIGLGLQRYLKVNSDSHQLNWAGPYFAWMTSRIEQVTKGHGFIGAAILVVPVLIIVAVVFALAYSWLGRVGYSVLNVALLWYCMDGRDINKEPYPDMMPSALLLVTYRHLFGVIFWYALFGPVGLSLYFSVMKLQEVVAAQGVSSTDVPADRSLLKCLGIVQGVLDWVPVRCLGLSFALVGHFGAVFKSWMQKLLHGIANTQELVAEWGMMALQPVGKGSASEAVGASSTEVITLIDRSLIVWLVVIVLVTLGVLFG